MAKPPVKRTMRTLLTCPQTGCELDLSGFFPLVRVIRTFRRRGAEMSRPIVLALFFLAVFLQSGTYGLTFLLPELFAGFGANEKDVGAMLLVTKGVKQTTVYSSGHLSYLLGRLKSLGLSGSTIALALFLYRITPSMGPPLILAIALI